MKEILEEAIKEIETSLANNVFISLSQKVLNAEKFVFNADMKSAKHELSVLQYMCILLINSLEEKKYDA